VFEYEGSKFNTKAIFYCVASVVLLDRCLGMWWASHIIFVSVQKLSSSSSQRRKAIGCLCSGISLLLHLVITTVVHNA